MLEPLNEQANVEALEAQAAQVQNTPQTQEGQQSSVSPEEVKPSEGDKPEGETKEEINGQTVEIAADSPFAPFQELRTEMLNSGFDFKPFEEKFSKGEAFTDADFNSIAEGSKRYKPAEVKAWFEQLGENKSLAEKAAKLDEKEQNEYISEIDTLAGGNYKELCEFIQKNADKEQVQLWNVALKTQDVDIQKAAVKQMQSFRLSKQPSDLIKKEADLSLLTKANNSPPSTQTTMKQPNPEEAKNPLEGNPFANATLQQLTAIKLRGSQDARFEQVMEVLKVRAPHLV